MPSSPQQPYQAQIDTLSERLDHHDERFDQLESKLDHLIRAFEKSPMPDQTKTSPHIVADFMVGVVIFVNGLCTNSVNLKSLSLRNLNNYFTFVVTIESREVIVDTVRGTLEDVRLAPLETIEGRVTIEILET